MGVGVAALLPAARRPRRVRLAAGRARRSGVRGDGLASPPGPCSSLVPSIADMTSQLGARGAQTLLPSVEAAYPWVLGPDRRRPCSRGFGLARRRLGRGGDAPAAADRGRGAGAAPRGVERRASSPPWRWPMSSRCATGSATSSRFGPTDRTASRPSAMARWASARSARLEVHFEGTLDGRSMGTIDARRRADPWPMSAGWPTSPRRATSGSTARRSSGERAWIREPYQGWRSATIAEVGDAEPRPDRVPRRPVAGGPGSRRIARRRAASRAPGPASAGSQVDGPTFRAAFPP